MSDKVKEIKGLLINSNSWYFKELDRFSWLMTELSNQKDGEVKNWLMAQLKAHPFFCEHTDYEILSSGLNELASPHIEKIYSEVENKLIPELIKILSNDQ